VTNTQRDPGIYPSDWKPPSTIADIQQTFEAHNFFDGRMIGGSKSLYIKKHTEDYLVLREISECLDTTLYVLWESDGRFGEENKPFDELIGKSVWNTDEPNPTKEWYLNKRETK